LSLLSTGNALGAHGCWRFLLGRFGVQPIPKAALTRLTASATPLAAALNSATGGWIPAANWAIRGSSFA
jgi:hypothetical protein